MTALLSPEPFAVAIGKKTLEASLLQLLQDQTNLCEKLCLFWLSLWQRLLKDEFPWRKWQLCGTFFMTCDMKWAAKNFSQPSKRLPKPQPLAPHLKQLRKLQSCNCRVLDPMDPAFISLCRYGLVVFSRNTASTNTQLQSALESATCRKTIQKPFDGISLRRKSVNLTWSVLLPQSRIFVHLISIAQPTD